MLETVNKIVTTPSQSTILLSLGADPNDSSMMHIINIGVDATQATDDDFEPVLKYRFDQIFSQYDLPAYTADDLIRGILRESRKGKNIVFSKYDTTLVTVGKDTMYSCSAENYVDMLFALYCITLRDKDIVYIRLNNTEFMDTAEISLLDELENASDINKWCIDNGICCNLERVEFSTDYWLTIPIKWLKENGHEDVLKYDVGYRSCHEFPEYNNTNIGLTIK